MNENCNSNLEMSFDELFQDQDFCTSDNCQKLMKRNNADMVIIKNGRVIICSMQKL